MHCLILGETGAGKSMFAELMYRFAIESHIIPTDAPFITLVECKTKLDICKVKLDP
ncbi:DUF87 domain-containing protein [Soehngenia longivitae]|uniref:DUF87 domain-containing protein n=1 Tax=Soehngenia longivitae TaxID=2562294 RepID=A0A4Z0D4P1_9FIRM|nr:DUF87 domain-containing protein [Soehngenia longivitae]